MKPLAHVLQATRPLAVHGDADRTVRAVTQDSRRVTPGACFVAVPGFTVDGHFFHPPVDSLPSEPPPVSHFRGRNIPCLGQPIYSVFA